MAKQLEPLLKNTELKQTESKSIESKPKQKSKQINKKTKKTQNNKTPNTTKMTMMIQKHTQTICCACENNQTS